jgi:hypothetical protein
VTGKILVLQVAEYYAARNARQRGKFAGKADAELSRFAV